MIISPGSWFSDLAGNLRAQKLNKAQIKRAKITGIQYFCGIWSFTCINRSGINLFSFINYHLPHNLRQLPFYPCSARRDTDAVAVIAITCPLRGGGGVHCILRRCRSHIQYGGSGLLYLSAITHQEAEMEPLFRADLFHSA